MKFRKPNRAVGIDLNAARTRVRRGRLPLRYLERLRVHFPDFPVRHKFRKPAISVLVERESVGGRYFLNLRELLRLRIKNSERASRRPYSSLRIYPQRVLGSARNRSFLAGNIRILKFRDGASRGIPSSDLVRTLLGQPDAAVRCGHCGVNRGRALVRHRILLHFSRFRIQPADLVRIAVIRHPVVAVFVRKCAPRHAARARQFVFDVHDLHRVIVESPDQFLVLRHFGRRLRQNRFLAEKRVDIRSDVRRILVVEWTANSSKEKVHRFLHVGDAVPPSFFIAPRGRHARLEPVARETSPDQQILPLGIGEQNLALILGQIAPAHHSLLQRKIVGGVLFRRQTHFGARIGAIAHGFYLHLIFAGGQILNPVAPVLVRQHADQDSRARVLRLNECASERSPVRTFHRASHGGRLGERGKKKKRSQKTGELGS